MEAAVSPLPDDVEALKALLTLALQKADEAEQHAAQVEAELANARALASAGLSEIPCAVGRLNITPPWL